MVIAVLAGDAAADRDCPGFPPVAIYDRRGSDDPGRWVAVRSNVHTFASVRDVVLESAVARVTYEPLSLVEQAGSHSLYVNLGGVWRRITGDGYGDYTYWVSTVARPAVAVEVERGPNAAEARFRYEHDTPVGDVVLHKTIALDRCSPGMFVRFTSDPANPIGEREIGIGRPLPIAYSKVAIAVHPDVNQHVSMNVEAAPGPYWAAAMAPGDLPFLALLVLAEPTPVYSYQFDPRQFGYLTVNRLTEPATAQAGYQVFVGAAELDGKSSAITVPPSDKDGPRRVPFVAPADGGYELALLLDEPAPAEDVILTIDDVAYDLGLQPEPSPPHQLIVPRVALRAGEHVAEVDGPAGPSVSRVLVLPLDGDDRFPEAVARRVQSTLRGGK